MNGVGTGNTNTFGYYIPSIPSCLTKPLGQMTLMTLNSGRPQSYEVAAAATKWTTLRYAQADYEIDGRMDAASHSLSLSL